MIKSDFLRKGLVLGVFTAVYIFGMNIAEHKRLWNDEIFTQTSIVQRMNILSMAAGSIAEGNNAPLYYMIQKLVTFDIWSGDDLWLKIENLTPDYAVFRKHQRVRIRFFSLLCSCLSVILIFNHFLKKSVFQGLFSLILIGASAPFWHHFVEGRPYSLWFLLTVIQFLSTKNFGLIYTLLSLTTPVSVIQISVHALCRKKLTVIPIPILICLFFWSRSPKYGFIVEGNPINLILDNVNIFFLLICFYKNKIFRGVSLASIAVVCFMVFTASDTSNGFALNSRYFLFLCPISIILMADFKYTLNHFIVCLVLIAVSLTYKVGNMLSTGVLQYEQIHFIGRGLLK